MNRRRCGGLRAWTWGVRGAGRDDGPAVPPLAGETRTGGAILQPVNEYLESPGIRIIRGTIVDATIIHAPSSTKNRSGGTRSRHASDAQGLAGALRAEGTHRAGLRPGTCALAVHLGGLGGRQAHVAGLAARGEAQGVGQRGLSGSGAKFRPQYRATVWCKDNEAQPWRPTVRSVGRECFLKERLYIFAGKDFRNGRRRGHWKVPSFELIAGRGGMARGMLSLTQETSRCVGLGAISGKGYGWSCTNPDRLFCDVGGLRGAVPAASREGGFAAGGASGSAFNAR
jgi:hypothetical protein